MHQNLKFSRTHLLCLEFSALHDPGFRKQGPGSTFKAHRPPLLQTYCKHRYLPYLESHAYSSKYKQLLACGSVMIAPRIEYPDFFLRGLVPGVHYVEVDPDRLCEDMIGACRFPPDSRDSSPSSLPSAA